MSRLQHIIPSGIIALVGIWVAYVSFTQQPAEAFLFPRLISVVFVALALWTFGKALLGWSRVGQGVSLELAKTIAPGLIVAGVYIFWGAKTLGFYAAATIAVFLLITWYDGKPMGKPMAALSSWIRRILITALIIAVLYGLFALLLSVYTPRGMFM
jgi:hypothetical protein